MIRRWSRVPLVGNTARARLGDRLTGRLWDYPRWLAPRAGDFDLFHIVDHSYAHLVRVLPAHRTVVTCHDLDAVQAALPGSRKRLDLSRLLASNILDGLARAGHVACVSQATKSELLATGRVKPDRVSVVYEGVHPSCVPDDRAASLSSSSDKPRILHVGSTIPRKRIDVLLKVLGGLRRTFTDLQLVRVGGKLAADQRRLATQLGVADAIVEMDFLERPALADVYRRASLVVLPSEREGFGLPVVEAMACGTQVVASAIPSLQEVGGSAAVYCPVGDVDRWVGAIAELLHQRQRDPAGWLARKRASIASASQFNWKSYAAEMAKCYSSLLTNDQRPTTIDYRRSTID